MSGFEDVHVHRFTDDGRYLICFSRNQHDLVVYRFKGFGAADESAADEPGRAAGPAPPSAARPKTRALGSEAHPVAPPPRRKRRGGEPRVAQPATTRDRYFDLLYTRPLTVDADLLARDFAVTILDGGVPAGGVLHAREAPPPRDRGAGEPSAPTRRRNWGGRATRRAPPPPPPGAGAGAGARRLRRPRRLRPRGWRRGRVSARASGAAAARARAPRLRRTRWRGAAPVAPTRRRRFRVRPPWTRWRFTWFASATGACATGACTATTTCACDARQPCPCSRRPRARAWCPCCRCGGRRFACCASPWRPRRRRTARRHRRRLPSKRVRRYRLARPCEETRAVDEEDLVASFADARTPVGSACAPDDDAPLAAQDRAEREWRLRARERALLCC